MNDNDNYKSIIKTLLDSNFISLVKDVAKPVFTSDDLMRLLNVKENTLRNYRDNGYLGYTRLGDKIWYTQQDVLKFLNNPKLRHEQFA